MWQFLKTIGTQIFYYVIYNIMNKTNFEFRPQKSKEQLLNTRTSFKKNIGLGKQNTFVYKIDVRRQECQIEISYLEGRINNRHPFICSLKNYQVSKVSNHTNRQIVVFADKVMPFSIEDWTQQKMYNALLGFKRLVMIYGPFLISKNLFNKSQQGEVKVWISGQIQKNKPDSTAKNEREILDSLLYTLKLQNNELAFYISDCKTLREMIERLKIPINPWKKGHKHTPSISMKIIEESSSNFEKALFQNCGKMSHQVSLACSPRAKSSSPDHIYQALIKSYTSTHRRQGSYCQNKFSSRPLSNLDQKKIERNLFQQKQRPSTNYHFNERPTVPQFPTFQQQRFSTTSSIPLLSQKKIPTVNHLDNTSETKMKNINGITIINNNVNNFYQEALNNNSRYSRQIQNLNQFQKQKVWRRSPSPELKQRKKYYPQPSVPSFLNVRKKGKSIFFNNVSYQNSTQLFQTRHSRQKSQQKNYNGRKKEKIFTFCKHEKEPVKPKLFFRDCSPKAAVIKEKSLEEKKFFAKSNTRSKSNYFPSKKSKMIPVSEIHEVQEVDNIKQSLQKQYALLLGLNPYPNQQPVKVTQKINLYDSEDFQKNSQVLLKQKIKKKKIAFAELKEQALKVLID